MELLLNELDTVRREELRGREYLVAPVTPMKSMRLDKGYVPKQEMVKSRAAWNGTPVTLNHPADTDGNLVSANSPGIAERTQLGVLYNVDVTDDGEMLEGEVWIDEMKANHIGDDAEAVIDRLDNGDSVSVSTSYFGDPLDAGEYDGEHREQVMGNLRPDHLALLPNKSGRCSIDDGCVAGDLAANSIQVAAAGGDPDDPADTGEDSTSQEGGSSGDRSSNGVLNGVRSVIASLTGNFGDVEEMPRDDGGKFIEKNVAIESLQDGDEIQAVKTSGDTMRAVYHRSDGSHLAVSTRDGEARLLAPGSVEQINVFSRLSGNSMKRDDKINFLVENTDLKRKSLEPMGDQCLTNVYDTRSSDEDNDDGEQSANSESEYVTLDDLEGVVGDAVEAARVANQEQDEREGHIDAIMANSDEYDRDELAETPVSTLATIEDSITKSSVNYAARGAGSSPVFNGDDEEIDTDAWEPRASKRVANEGGD